MFLDITKKDFILGSYVGLLNLNIKFLKLKNRFLRAHVSELRLGGQLPLFAFGPIVAL